MWYLIIAIVSIAWVSVFLWGRMESKRRKKEALKKKEKPSFRSEENLKGYGKPMEDYQPPTVDFDDAE